MRMSGNIFCSRQMRCKFTVVLFLFLYETIDYGQAKPVQNIQKKGKDLDKIRENDLLEGDMIIDQRVWNIITNQTIVENQKRSAVTSGVMLWPNGIVPYTIDSRLGRTAKEAIYDAINELHRMSCIQFRPRKNEHSYVRFIKGSGCYSYVGRQDVPQSISLGTGCESKGIALHEMMHALGFFHTSSRTDRDAYVIVYENNVATGYLGNFHKYPHGQIDSFGSPYDITSIMHLPRNAFAKTTGLYTILARAGVQIILGQTIGLSSVDNYQLNTLYKCSTASHGCLSALGLQSRGIKDGAMIASSSKTKYYPGQGRLHNSPSRYGNGAWCPYYNDKKPWIQVDLGHTITVSGIATQGLLSYINPSYVVKYELEYRKYSVQHWMKYYSFSRTYGNTQNLPGNWDEMSVQYNSLTPTFNARYVRIIPRSWVGAPCVRIEIYGCKV